MRVAFIIKGDAFSWKAHEALRQAIAVGMNHELDLVLIRDGVYTLTEWNQEKLGINTFDKFLETFEYVNVRVVVEDASAQERGLKEMDFTTPVEIMSAEEIAQLINSAEAVFVW
jgi:tRNA 2-thiouridine synthesizing protein C